jgi:calcium-dependent protein kinase
MSKKVVIKRPWFITSKTSDINADYQIIKELGVGGYGTVFLAQDRRSSVYRAVKVIKKEEAKQLQTIVKEISILKELDHPNIVNIIETYETEKNCFVVLEYCAGGEVFNRLVKLKVFSESHVAHVMRQLFSAIMYCHQHDICHRDLKPENLLYLTEDDNSEVKVIDFGLSAFVTEDDVLHDITGTVYYIAPEMLAGNYNKLADCWSLGVMMYVMLGGCAPFNGKDQNEIVMAVYNGSYSFRIPTFEHVSDSAKDLISRLLVKDCSRRFTAQQAYEHPWVQGVLLHYNQLPLSILTSIEKFTKAASIKKASLMYIASKLNESDIGAIRNHFKKIDVNGDGVISKDEMVRGIKEVTNIPDEHIEIVISSLDVNDNGVVDYTEFLTGCLLRRSFSNTGYIESAFKHFDKDESGFITPNEIREALCGGDILHNLSTYEIEQMIREIDRNQDGCIDYREFIEMLNQRSLL